MTSNNSLNNSYKNRLKLTLVHICKSLKRLWDQLKVLTSYKIIQHILTTHISLHIFLFISSRRSIQMTQSSNNEFWEKKAVTIFKAFSITHYKLINCHGVIQDRLQNINLLAESFQSII